MIDLVAMFLFYYLLCEEIGLIIFFKLKGVEKMLGLL